MIRISGDPGITGIFNMFSVRSGNIIYSLFLTFVSLAYNCFALPTIYMSVHLNLQSMFYSKILYLHVEESLKLKFHHTEYPPVYLLAESHS
jgi:hypothetical protein